MQNRNLIWQARVFLALGTILFLSGSAVVEHQSPTYGDWFKVIVGLLIAMVSAYAKGIADRVTKVETRAEATGQRIGDLKEVLVGQHYDKDEVDRRFDRLERLIAESRSESMEGIAALHRRLDFLRVPPASGFHPG